MRRISIIVLAVLIAALPGLSALASGDAAFKAVEARVAATNNQIYRAIDTAKDRAASGDDVDKVIAWLEDHTYGLASRVISWAAKHGVKVICYLIEVEIGGRSVSIDPVRVYSD